MSSEPVARGSPPAAEIALFTLNPALARAELGRRFARDGRVQIRNFLAAAAAETIFGALSGATPWGLAANPGAEPVSLRRDALARLSPAERQKIGTAIGARVRAGGYGFAYHHYPMVPAYLERWSPGGVHDLLLEHINDEPLMQLVRDVTGMTDLVKADAQATLFAPNQFLGVHIDSHVAEGWKLAYVMSFARDWREDWGGYLLFYDEEGDVVAGYKPRFNCLTLFAVPQRHAVSYVPPFAPFGRFSITGWFRDR